MYVTDILNEERAIVLRLIGGDEETVKVQAISRPNSNTIKSSDFLILQEYYRFITESFFSFASSKKIS